MAPLGLMLRGERTMMDAMHLLKRDEAVLVVIDVQDKLHRVIADAHAAMRNVASIAKGARLLGLPVLVTEQYPQGIGSTVAEVKEAAGGAPVIEKREFGGFSNDAFRKAIAPYANKTLILCGFETHVCVLQTALQARGLGHRVFVVADAVGSRSEWNKQLALERMREAGCTIVSTEMALFELLATSAAPEFKEIQKLIK